MSLSKPRKNLTNHQCDKLNHIHVAKHAKKFDIHLILINLGFKKSLLKLEIKYLSLSGSL